MYLFPLLLLSVLRARQWNTTQLNHNNLLKPRAKYGIHTSHSLLHRDRLYNGFESVRSLCIVVWWCHVRNSVKNWYLSPGCEMSWQVLTAVLYGWEILVSYIKRRTGYGGENLGLRGGKRRLGKKCKIRKSKLRTLHVRSGQSDHGSDRDM